MSLQLEISSICALESMEKAGEVRKGGGYLQREKLEKMRKCEAVQPSGLAQYMVLNPPPLDIPPPTKLCLYLSL